MSNKKLYDLLLKANTDLSVYLNALHLIKELCESNSLPKEGLVNIISELLIKIEETIKSINNYND